HPPLDVLWIGGGDQLRQRGGEISGQGCCRAVEVRGELLGGVVGGEYPPLESVAALASDRGPGPLGGAVVGDHTETWFGFYRRVIDETAEDVEVVFADRLITPQSFTDRGMDAVSADNDIGLDDLS